jgi:uncharacterized membrane protein YkgB
MTGTMERRHNAMPIMAQTMEYEATLQAVAAHLLRYGLVFVIAWIGFMKFTAYEAAGIQPLVANSPLMGWVYSILSVPSRRCWESSRSPSR